MSYASPTMAAFDLLLHVPPKDVEDRMFDIFNINEELTDELISSVDVPLKVEEDTTVHQNFVKCDYNRDGDSYRSPYSNEYFPPIDDGQQIPDRLRKIEVLANNGFSAYLSRYFGHGTLSAYCWEISDNEFGLGVFVQKDADDVDGEYKFKGSISCSDVFTIADQGNSKYEYQLVSSLVLELQVDVEGQPQPVVLSGSCTDQHTKVCSARDNVEILVNAGEMIEANASDFMEHVRQIYVGKMKEILSYTKGYSIGGRGPMAGMSPQDALAAALNARLKK